MARARCAGRCGFGLLLAAATAGAGWCASPIASGDRPIDKSATGNATSGVRNYDWLRPRPEDVTPNPQRSLAGRPFLKDVRPWTSDVEFRIQAPPVDWTQAKEQEEEEARWRRPTPQEIAPNPPRGVGARPYLRYVKPVDVLVQRDVRDYGAGTGDRTTPDIAAPMPGGTPAAPDAAKPFRATSPPAQGTPGTQGAAADQPAQSAGGETAPDAAGTGAAAGRTAQGTTATGTEAGQTPAGGGGQQAGETGQEGGAQQPGGTGQQAGGEFSGKDKENASGAHPDLREYLAGARVVARDSGDELAQRMAALFGPIPERQAAPPMPAPPAANADTAAPTPNAAPASWWHRVVDLLARLWGRIVGGVDPAAPSPPAPDSQSPPSAFERSVRGDIR